jgi:hypothetical protein
VDLERLVGDLPLAPVRERGERAHVVEAIGELHEEHTDVAGHRHDHLADVLGLGQLTAAELELVELGEPVDDPRDLVAELPLDVAEADRGVLDRVVEEGGGQGGGVQTEVGEDRGDGDGVLDVGVTRLADGALVRLGRHLVGVADLGGRGLGVPLVEPFQDAGQLRRPPAALGP